jgi:lipopolysaccharide transport system permease protein
MSTIESNPAEVEYDRIIRPRRGLVGVNLKELWQFRELFLFFVWRDILVRYKQTYLGIAWAVLQPFLTMVVFSIIFGVLARLPSSGVPYAVMTLAALLPWQIFASAVTESSGSLVVSARMISKIYFPRLIVPASAVLGGVIDFLVGFVMLLLLMWYYHVPVTARILLLPLFLAVAYLAAFAVGFWFSALNVKYRDVKYVVPFITRIGVYVSSVAFSTQWVASKVSEKWLFVYSLNPMVGVIDGFRWCILGAQFEPYWPGFWMGLGLIVALLVSGLLYFRSTEKTFADLV